MPNHGGLHNTDPFIFGDRILYSSCGRFGLEILLSAAGDHLLRPQGALSSNSSKERISRWRSRAGKPVPRHAPPTTRLRPRQTVAPGGSDAGEIVDRTMNVMTGHQGISLSRDSKDVGVSAEKMPSKLPALPSASSNPTPP